MSDSSMLDRIESLRADLGQFRPDDPDVWIAHASILDRFAAVRIDQVARSDRALLGVRVYDLEAEDQILLATRQLTAEEMSAARFASLGRRAEPDELLRVDVVALANDLRPSGTVLPVVP